MFWRQRFQTPSQDSQMCAEDWTPEWSHLSPAQYSKMGVQCLEGPGVQTEPARWWELHGSYFERVEQENHRGIVGRWNLSTALPSTADKPGGTSNRSRSLLPEPGALPLRQNWNSLSVCSHLLLTSSPRHTKSSSGPRALPPSLWRQWTCAWSLHFSLISTPFLGWDDRILASKRTWVVQKTFKELSGHFQQIRHLGSIRYLGKLNGQVIKRSQGEYEQGRAGRFH